MAIEKDPKSKAESPDSEETDESSLAEETEDKLSEEDMGFALFCRAQEILGEMNEDIALAYMLIYKARDTEDLELRTRVIKKAISCDPKIFERMPVEFGDAIQGLEKKELYAVMTEIFRNREKYPATPFHEDPSTLLVTGPIVGEDALRVLEIIREEMPDCRLKQSYLKWLPRVIALREQGLDFKFSSSKEGIKGMPPMEYIQYPTFYPKRYSTLSDELYHMGKIELSNKYLALAVRLDPTKGRRQARLITSFIDLGDYESALKVLQPEAEWTDDDIFHLHYLIDRINDLKSIEAIRLKFTLMRLVDDHSDVPEFRKIRPIIDGILGPLDPSKVELDETNPDSLWLHAIQLEIDGKIPEATEYMQKAVKLAPENADMQANLGKLYIIQTEIPKALVHFHAAVKHQPQNSLYRQVMGYALEEAGRLEEALEEYEKALSIEQDNQYYENVIRVLVNLKRNEEACEILEKAREFDPENMLYTAFQALIVGSLGNYERAAHLGEEALQKANKNIEVIDMVATLYSLLDQHERALSIIKYALSLEPENHVLFESFHRISQQIPPDPEYIALKLKN